MPESASTLPRHEWINAFVSEWNRLQKGRCDLEEAHEIGLTLSRVVGDQPPKTIAAMYFDSFTESEDRVRDPEAEYTALAADLGIIKAGDKLDQAQLDFAYGVAELCAAIGDRYGDPSDGNAGDHIRSVYGPV